ncbi:hypothetical protein BSL78_03930 [Apostichopus japonicus]|uniref:HYDIN/VesB/CFA65-like Ig-like domain-containing protein n=1 Tax=Stichopus japonicus TaxID=307972 RepID=A0A2G8LFV0_STIJA|nr:hypothetical protein BSL78_03930 [Apostichopus japonicus]
MDGDVVGVRIIPPVIEFYDAETSTIHCQNVTVQNISSSSKQIKFHGPDSKVTATVEFSTEERQDYQDRIILQVDDDVIEIPLCAYSPQPLLDLEGPVDFGCVVRNCKVLSKEITLYNHGTLPGNFTISYSGEKPVTIKPTKGTLKPHTAQNVKVEFVTKYVGILNEEAEVQLDGQEPSTLQIKAEVVESSLQILSPKNGQQLKCIKFGCIYYGTDKTQPAVLFNNSPDVVNFVTSLDEEAEGMEWDTFAKTKSCSSSLTSLMRALPNQGTLLPYEKVPIFFRFSPRYNNSRQGWKGTSTPPPRQDFALYMNIVTVGNSGGSDVTNEKEIGIGEGDQRTPLDSVQQVIHSLHILLTGQGISTFKKKEPKFNPGITPLVVGEVGQLVDVKVDELKAYQQGSLFRGSEDTRTSTR